MHTFHRSIPVQSIMHTELEKNGITRSECIHNQCLKSLTEMGKINDLGLEFRQHSPPSWLDSAFRSFRNIRRRRAWGWNLSWLSGSGIGGGNKRKFLFGIVVVIVDRLIDIFRSYLPLNWHVINRRDEDIILVKLDVAFNGYSASAWPINGVSMHALIVVSNPASNLWSSF